MPKSGVRKNNVAVRKANKAAILFENSVNYAITFALTWIPIFINALFVHSKELYYKVQHQVETIYTVLKSGSFFNSPSPEYKAAPRGANYKKAVGIHIDQHLSGVAKPSSSLKKKRMKPQPNCIDKNALDDFLETMYRNNIVTCYKKHSLDTFYREEIQLPKSEMKVCSDSIKKFKENVMSEMEKQTGFKWEFFNGGSYFDGTKVSKANEADCLLLPVMNSENLKIEYHLPNFCFIKASSSTLFKKLKISDGKYLSSEMYRQFVFNHLEKIMKLPQFRKWERLQKFSGSPSFCVRHTESGLDMDVVPALKVSQWPEHANQLKCLDNQRAREITSKGVHVVVKDCTKDMKNTHNLWQLSFCQAEKMLTKFADQRNSNIYMKSIDILWQILFQKEKITKFLQRSCTCRKFVMKVLKRILEADGNLDKESSNTAMKKLIKASDYIKEHYPGLKNGFKLRFTTYHVRTLMWTLFCHVYPEPHLWHNNSKPEALYMTLIKLQNWLAWEMDLHNFFLPDLEVTMVFKEERQYIYLMAGVAIKLFCTNANDEV